MKKVFFSLMCVSAMLLTLVSCKKDDTPDQGGNPAEKKALATPSVQISEQTANSFTVTWGEVANAAGYKVSFNGTESDVAETSKKFEGLQAGEYTVKVKAVAAADSKEYKDSEWAETKVTIENGGTTPTNNPWLGTWTVTTTKTIRVTQQGYEWVETPCTFDIVITSNEEDKEGKTVIVTGFSKLGNDVPTLATFDEFTFAPYTGIAVGEADSEGYTPVWCPFVDIQGEINILTGQMPAFTFTLSDDGKSANGVAFEGALQDGSSFKCIGLEVLALSEDGKKVAFYTESFPVEYPGGEFSMVKKSSASAAPAKAERNIQFQKSDVTFAL